MLHIIALVALALLPAVQGAPATSTSPQSVYKRCGPVSQYYNQKASDWDTYKTGDWLNNWWNHNANLISKNTAGFAGAFGQWAIGNPDWTCRDDGSSSDCDLNLCDNRVLNDRGNDIRPSYYVLESVNRLHSYFTGVGQAFSTAALGAALSKDQWATTFYKDKDDKDATVLKEVLNAVVTVIGIGASFAGLGGGPVVGAFAGAGAALAGGANAAAGIVLGTQYVSPSTTYQINPPTYYYSISIQHPITNKPPAKTTHSKNPPTWAASWAPS